MFFLSRMLNNKLHLPEPAHALPGRPKAIATARSHHVFKRPLKGPAPVGMEQAMFAMGCFWAAERLFWTTSGIWMTAAGYSGGFTPNPTYQECCTGLTGHAETVLVTFDPEIVSYAALLAIFWQSHDPTQGMRQGADMGTAYRSAIYAFSDRQRRQAESARDAYQRELKAAGYDRITTEIAPAGPFFYAEAEHQQYVSKNPESHCGLKGSGVACVVPAVV